MFRQRPKGLARAEQEMRVGTGRYPPWFETRKSCATLLQWNTVAKRICGTDMR